MRLNTTCPDSAKPSRRLELNLFGIPALRVQGRSVKIVSARCSLELLAFIALSADRTCERAAAATAVWPDSEDPKAELRRHLLYVDRALAMLGETPIVLRDGSCLSLQPIVFVDALDERRHDEPYEPHDGGRLAAFLEGYEKPWIEAVRVRLREQLVARLERALDEAIEREDVGATQHIIVRLQRSGGTAREAALRKAIQFLSARGEHARALRVLNDAAATARRLDGVELSTQLCALRDEIVRETVPRRRCYGFPPESTKLFGREDDIAALTQALERQRLVICVGPPGIGKTRVASAVAAALSKGGDMPAFFVDVAHAPDAEAIAAGIAGAIAAEHGAGPLGGTFDDFLHARRAVIVLDNCERAADAVREVAARVLACSAEARIVATSRVSLRAPGEMLWELEPLGIEAATKLFEDRAQLVRTSMRGHTRAAHDIAELCRRLDGLPLAIELAAARLRSMSLQQLSRSLSGDAVGSTRSVVGSTLRATFDWSLELLDPVERRLLARISVFRGGFSSESAAALDGEAIALTEDRLATLADHSLIVPPATDEEFPRYTLLQPLREYGLALLAESGEFDRIRNRHARLFADRYIDRSDELNGPRAHQHVFDVERETENIRAALHVLIRQGVDPERGAWLCDALRRVWFTAGHVVEAARWVDSALASSRITGRLREKMLMERAVMARHQHDYRGAVARYEEVLALHGAGRHDDDTVALVNVHISGCLSTIGETARARRFALRGKRLLERGGDPYNTGFAYMALGLAEHAAGNVDAAEKAHRRALALFEAASADVDIAATLSNLACCALQRGDAATADELSRESIRIAEAATAPFVVAASRVNLASTAIDCVDLEAARRHCLAALKISLEANDFERLAEAFENAARIADVEENWRTGATLLGAADGLRARSCAVRTAFTQQTLHAVQASLRAQLGEQRTSAIMMSARLRPVAEIVIEARALLAPIAEEPESHRSLDWDLVPERSAGR